MMVSNFFELGFFRVAAVSSKVELANPKTNAQEILQILQELLSHNVHLANFSELCLTGYTISDLFFQSYIFQEVEESLDFLCKETIEIPIVFTIGFPYLINGKIANCAGIFYRGKIYGIVPKTYLPNTFEFYENRWFSPSWAFSNSYVFVRGKEIPFGTQFCFTIQNRFYPVKIGIEICEDLWAVEPPSGKLALGGANLILNLSASPEVLGKSEYRRTLVEQQSARCNAVYVYSSAGASESTTDVVYSGHCMIVENGITLAEAKNLSLESKWILADIDIEKLQVERTKNKTFLSQNVYNLKEILIPFDYPKKQYSLSRHISKTPFVPSDISKREENCKKIFEIQSFGLAKRIQASKAQALVIGVSGGLDSTLALLVCERALKILGLAADKIQAFTLPGFGTTSRTKNNAIQLANLLGAKIQTISIVDSVLQHFKDIGHDVNNLDVTYENAQARERTQILMDIANKFNGIVVGTGDLSELALGWCTYNADQMSMYNVNAGVPKTLVRYVVEYCADHEYSGELSLTLRDICNTPISPELLPPNADKISQETEEIIGPYLLHDFFLYHFMRLGYTPKKIFYLARIAFQKEYSDKKILDTLKIFYKRFFQNQFKRSAMPDGVKVGSVALSPRGDWRMPSDAEAKSYLQAIQELEEELKNEMDTGNF
ncbi:MAG: NAD(+) synthase [Leptospiraceae bacterium]|nr:NAD(+) synthase [Leptospiraceae bacterium]